MLPGGAIEAISILMFIRRAERDLGELWTVESEALIEDLARLGV